MTKIILTMLQVGSKISVLQDRLMQIQFHIKKVSAYIEMLLTNAINPTLINSPDLQYLLYDIKDQLQ